MYLFLNITTIIVFIISLFLNTDILGYTNTTPFSFRITYIFAHANIFHLVGNIYSLYIFKKLFDPTKLNTYLIISTLSAIIATYGTEQSLPTVGISAIIYALLGIYYAQHTSKRAIIYILTIFVLNYLPYIIGLPFNAHLHTLSFTYTYIPTLIYTQWKKRKTQLLAL